MTDLRFDPQQPLSHFTIGNQDSPLFRIVMLHGNGACSTNGDGGCAQRFKKAAELMLKHFPKAAITLINGRERIPESTIEQLHPDNFQSWPPVFSWYGDICGLNGHNAVADIIRGFGDDPKKVVVFGFSQGGFMASQIVHNHPDVARHAFLHSSALIGSYKNPPAGSASRCTYDTILSTDDPFLRTRMILGLFKHYHASCLFKMRGHKARTQYSNGFGHDVTEKSAAIAAKIIRNRLAADGLRFG